MKLFLGLAAIASTLILGASSPARAESCYDLWYARNLIYAENGYCFKTALGKQTFSDSYDCYTSNPHLSKAERNEVASIKREERQRGCHVN
jgi:YARHG domain